MTTYTAGFECPSCGQPYCESTRFCPDCGTPVEIETVNGIIRAITLVRGRVGGTWTMRGGRVELGLWNAQSRATTVALERDASAVQVYLSAS